MFLTLMASISGFIFMGIAAMFGSAFGIDATEFYDLVARIFLFVCITSFILGIVFGRPGYRGAVIAGCLALTMMSLPLQVYAGSATSIARYLGLLSLLFFLVACTNFLGTRINPAVVAKLRELAH